LAGRYWIGLGALLAAIAVAAGALGAHFLKDLVKRELLSSDHLASFETAVRYQMYHSLALVLVGLLLERWSSGLVQAAAIAFLLGILLFSGGIYGWLATGIKPLVHIVPVGGLIWIVGWLLFAAGAIVSGSRPGAP
jgi:uncharacterized membrane protein YgdD (TMEM256/DUF423 family)